MPEHLPVMLQETLDALAARPGARFIDGTLGLGGHAAALPRWPEALENRVVL